MSLGQIDLFVGLVGLKCKHIGWSSSEILKIIFPSNHCLQFERDINLLSDYSLLHINQNPYKEKFIILNYMDKDYRLFHEKKKGPFILVPVLAMPL